MQAAQGDQKSDREGMIQVNDLVYKLEPDISVAVNRTHKNHFFQQSEYKSSQTSISILNSGADYIDCRRSFLHFEVDLTCMPHQILQYDTWHTDEPSVEAWVRACAQNYNDNKLVHGYFGPNGSILNLIDTVTVATRSGDELSRIQNVALLANTTLPLIYGDDWRKSVGSMIGFGDCVYGRSAKREHPYARRRYSIPLYLLSPLFQYGRLMPSMLMSGLKITLTWKPASKAFAQFVGSLPATLQNYGGYVRGVGVNESFIPFSTEGKDQDPLEMLMNTRLGDVPLLMPAGITGVIPQSTAFTAEQAVAYREAQLQLGQLWQQCSLVSTEGGRPDRLGAYYGDIQPYNVYGVDTFTSPTADRAHPTYWGTGADTRIGLPTTVRGPGLLVPGYARGPAIGEQPLNGIDLAGDSALSRTLSRLALAKYEQNPPFVEEYTIRGPEFSLCSVQLSDAIQRTLNEYSAVNGLEIVYTDYDLTSAPVVASKDGTSVYTEVRKSASRALQAFARIVPDYSATIDKTSDSNAASIQYYEDLRDGAIGWLDYQWQLGSLYFPQQKVQARAPMEMATLAYSYTLEAFDRMSGATSCMLRLQDNNTAKDTQVITLDRTLAHRNAGATAYAAAPDLLSQERLYIKGKPGSFCGGGEVIAVSLERSSLFNLSGIPINNSRVLALRGNYSMVPTPYCSKHTLHIFLKYVKLARIFLNNVEVEQ